PEPVEYLIARALESGRIEHVRLEDEPVELRGDHLEPLAAAREDGDRRACLPQASRNRAAKHARRARYDRHPPVKPEHDGDHSDERGRREQARRPKRVNWPPPALLAQL